MRITPHGALVFFLLLAAATIPAAAAVTDEPYVPLVIRLYDVGPASGVDEGAVQEAQLILAGAGFAPEWVRCAPGDPATAERCAQPLGGAELAVRLVAAAGRQGAANQEGSRRRTDRASLGYSLVDPRTRSGALATIYLDRVAWLASEARADTPVLLGRAIAHEVGHLLLGTAQHARSGLMRAVWARDAVRGSRAGEWRFLAAEARRMRHAVAARSAVGQLARHVNWGD